MNMYVDASTIIQRLINNRLLAITTNIMHCVSMITLFQFLSFNFQLKKSDAKIIKTQEIASVMANVIGFIFSTF